jgi:acetamidase/formamidase
VTTPVPRRFGGNMDNKELRAGTTLYLPVFNREPEPTFQRRLEGGDADLAVALHRVAVAGIEARDPFFGVLAVAPPAEWGRVTTPVPRRFGGNMDNNGGGRCPGGSSRTR